MQRDYVSQRSPGGRACARQGWLEGGRGGKGKAGGWPSDRTCRGSLVPRSGEGRVIGGRRRRLRCRGGRRRNAPHGCRRRGLTAGEEEQKGRPGTALCRPRCPRQSDPGVGRGTPLSVSVAFVSWSRCRVPEPAGTRPCQDRRVGKAGLERPTPALLKQNNVRFLPLVFFLADVTGNPLI